MLGSVQAISDADKYDKDAEDSVTLIPSRNNRKTR